jgi:hypothetical protein
MLPLASVLPAPSRVTLEPGATTWSLPAFALGGALTAGGDGDGGTGVDPPGSWPLSPHPLNATNTSPGMQRHARNDLFMTRVLPKIRPGIHKDGLRGRNGSSRSQRRLSQGANEVTMPGAEVT